jgi:hypothetical protein
VSRRRRTCKVAKCEREHGDLEIGFDKTSSWNVICWTDMHDCRKYDKVELCRVPLPLANITGFWEPGSKRKKALEVVMLQQKY